MPRITLRPATATLFAASLPLAAQAQALTCESADPAPGAAPICAPLGDRAYRHPLTTGIWSAGQVPLLDVKDDPAGRRYAYVDGATAQGGRLTRHLGVAVLERSALGAPPSRGPSRQVHLRGDLAEALARTAPSAPMTLVVHVRVPPTPALERALERALATGAVRTRAERRAFRASELGRRRAAMQAALSALSPVIEAAGFTVERACGHTPCFVVTGPAGRVPALAARPEVRAVGLRSTTGRTHMPVQGARVARISQVEPFYTYLYSEGGQSFHVDGENGTTWDITGAVFEPDGFRDSHAAFLDWGGGPPRIRARMVCGVFGCGTVSGTWSGSSASKFHGTAILGMFLGDAFDNQLPYSAFIGGDRSWGAPEARAHLVDYTFGAAEVAYDAVLAQPIAPHVAVHANGDDDPTCSAVQTGFAEEACENLYQNGVAVFASVGNEGGAVGDCRADEPATGLCTIAVGAYDPPATFGGGLIQDCVWRNAPTFPDASRGGQCDGTTTSNVQGYCRTIVDYATPACMTKMPHSTGDLDFIADTECGTSVSVALAAGHAASFVDAYKANFSDAIDDPGLLQAWLLQMGDRPDGAFTDRLGGGREKMRMPNSAGLDAPWSFFSVQTCIDDGERYLWPLDDANYGDGIFAPRTLSPDVDDLTVTTWFYDREFQRTSRAEKRRVDRYTLLVRDADTGAVLGIDASQDEKKRIRLSGVGGRRIAVEVLGHHVTNDHLGCGQNSLRLYMAVLAEDDDRDDGDGPHWDPALCQGTEPMIAGP